jgi:hypothetical protein
MLSAALSTAAFIITCAGLIIFITTSHDFEIERKMSAEEEKLVGGTTEPEPIYHDKTNHPIMVRSALLYVHTLELRGWLACSLSVAFLA